MNKVRSILVVALLAAALGLVGCSLFTVEIDESSAGSIQRLDVGDLLIVRLPGNATTGYEWARVQPISFDVSPLQIVQEGDYQADACDLVGAPGEFIFRYRAIQQGTVTIAFEHRRPWETDQPIESYSVTVWVQ
jgi:predicted secreted protein